MNRGRRQQQQQQQQEQPPPVEGPIAAGLPAPSMDSFEYIDKLPKDVECSLCLMPWWDPLEAAPCRHVFCRGCLRDLLKATSASVAKCPNCRADMLKYDVPNRALINIVDALIVRCCNCAWEGPREGFAPHTCKHLSPVDRARELGQKLFRDKKYREADAVYVAALSLPTVQSDVNRCIIHSNRSLCLSLLGEWAECYAQGQAAVAANPAFAKGYYRVAVAIKHIPGKPIAEEIGRAHV